MPRPAECKYICAECNAIEAGGGLYCNTESRCFKPEVHLRPLKAHEQSGISPFSQLTAAIVAPLISVDHH